MPRHIGPNRGDGDRINPFEDEDATQETTIGDDGSVTIVQEATDRDGETISREITIEDDADGGVDLTFSFTNAGGEAKEKTQSIDETEDGTVTITSTGTNRDGEEVTKTVEISEGDDGFVFTVTRTDAEGEEETFTNTMMAEGLLDGVEELSVETVTTALLEHKGIDLADVDFSGIEDFA